MQFSWTVLVLFSALTIYLCKNRRYRWFYILTKTFRRDFWGAFVFSKMGFILLIAELRNDTVVNVFESFVKKQPKKAVILFEEETWTYEELNKFSNKIARYFKNEGFRKGDSIALFLENRPEYVGIWLGLSKIGVVTALINTNLVNDPLVHSVSAAKCKAIIFGSLCASVVKDVAKDLEFKKFYQFHETIVKENTEVLPEFIDLRLQLANISGDTLSVNEKVLISIKDPILYIYTSGTTGLPKAAVVNSVRYMFAAKGMTIVLRFEPNDVFYTPLPLYHSAAGMLGIGQALVSGVTVAMRKKFSASNYWKDCAKYNCTAAQYIGEVCRYILIAHKDVEPVKHPVRAIIGNGLRPQIWKQFTEKFNIKEVFEFYGATEGIANIINIDNQVGAVGFIPWYARWAYPLTLIKCDECTGEPIRDKNGYCIECDINQPGLLIGQINQKKSLLDFQGYADKKATKKKILHNVFCDGDAYFNSGDVLVTDEYGYFYFKDRTGDTFRWKGENVSTAEIEAVISNLTRLADAVVFGVQIPHSEGRAGMAAVVDAHNTLDLHLLSSSIKNNIPSYAIPMFIRVMESVPMTGTFKLKKIELQAEGYDINKIKDKVYFYDPKLKEYTELTKDTYQKIINGNLSL